MWCVFVFIINRKFMLYIKCDTRDMNYAGSSVCADERKAQGTFGRVAMKIYNEFQVHHFLMEDKKHPSMQIFARFFSFYEYFTTSKRNAFPKCNLSKFCWWYYVWRLQLGGRLTDTATNTRTHLNVLLCDAWRRPVWRRAVWYLAHSWTSDVSWRGKIKRAMDREASEYLWIK